MGLLWFLPVSMLPLAAVALAFAVMFRFMSFRSAVLMLVALALAPALIDPLIDLAFDILPWWILLPALVFILLALVRMVLSLVLGAGATDHVVGQLVAAGLVGLFRLALVPFRIMGWLVGRILLVR
jgi:hypothetical protein